MMSSPTLEQSFSLALRHHQVGRLSEAEQIYRQILAQQPAHVGATHYLGVMAHQQGRNDVAVDLIRSAIALSPNLPEAHNNLGLALKETGQIDEAIASYQRALALRPNYANAFYNLGIVLHCEGRLDDAIAAFRQAISLRPDYVEAYNNLGNALLRNRQFGDAIVALRRAIAISSQRTQAQANLDDASRNKARHDQATAFSNLGSAFHQNGQLDEAIAACRQAIALNPDLVVAYNNLAFTLAEKGLLADAIDICRQTVAIDQNPPKADRGLAAASHLPSTPQNVIIPPYQGEFGCKLLRHVRFVHELHADAKLVCCGRGEESLYPSATGFEYEWQHAGPDELRIGDGPKGKAPHRDGYAPIDPVYAEYGPWKKFKPVATARLSPVDVALGVRQRAQISKALALASAKERADCEWMAERNWAHWDWLASRLRELGLTIGLVGHPESSQTIPAQVRAWDHPDGCTAGSIDLLSRCRLYVGTDSGATHLAAMCDAPTVGFRLARSSPDFMLFAQIMNQREFTRLPNAAWNDRHLVLEAVIASLHSALCRDRVAAR